MSTAICLYGQPRKYKQVLDQWRYIISELDADVFIHTWYGQDRGRVGININELIEDFSPKEIRVSAPHKFRDIIPAQAEYENTSYHAMNQAYSINESVVSCISYSKSLRKEYSTMVRSRFDLTLENPRIFVEFVKNNIENGKVYVAGNHWQGSQMFDDNLMIGQADIIKRISTDYFEYTIDTINKTNIIPGGESNIHKYINDNSMSQAVTKETSLNHSLIRLPIDEIIINQNEN